MYLGSFLNEKMVKTAWLNFSWLVSLLLHRSVRQCIVRLCNVFEDNNLKFSLKKNRNTIEFIYMHYQSTDTFKNNLSKEKKQYFPFCAHKDDTGNALLY